VGGDGALDEEVVGGLGGGGPLEGDFVADALGGEVGDEAWEVEGWGAGWAGAGASGDQDGEGCDERGRECVRESVMGRFAGRAHLSQPSILSGLGSGCYVSFIHFDASPLPGCFAQILQKIGVRLGPPVFAVKCVGPAFGRA
jgi:hypothetical protein